MPDSASSAVVVLRAIVSWTSVLTRWSGRPNTIATAIKRRREQQDDEQQRRAEREQDDDRADEPDERRQQARDGLGQHRPHERHVARQARHQLPDPAAGVEVERQRHQPPEQVAAELGDDPLPDDAEEVRLEEAADGLDAEQAEQA